MQSVIDYQEKDFELTEGLEADCSVTLEAMLDNSNNKTAISRTEPSLKLIRFVHRNP